MKNIINNIEKLKEYLGKEYTIAYRSKYSDIAMVNGVLIPLPISFEVLEKILKKTS